MTARHGDPARLLAVGRFGRTVVEAAVRFGLNLPVAELVAPGDPLPLEDPLVVVDTAVESGLSGTMPWGRSTARPDGDSGGAPEGGELVCRIPGAQIAFRRDPGAPEAVAISAAALAAGDIAGLQGAHSAEVKRLDLRPDGPRVACGRLLAQKAVARLLAVQGEAIAAVESKFGRNFGTAAHSLPGECEPGDPVAPIAADFEARRIAPRDLLSRVRAAVAGLGQDRKAVPITALAADLDRRLSAAIATGGLAAGRALLTALLADVRGWPRPEDSQKWPGPARGRDWPLQSGIAREHDGAAELAWALDDLERRSRSIALVLTLTRRDALLDGLRLVSAATRQTSAQCEILPDPEPVLAMIESRWGRLDDCEDRLCDWLDRQPPAQVRALDYLGSLPGGEEAAIDTLLSESGLGPAVLSGDPAAYLESQATRFFTWVPDVALADQLADLPAGGLAAVVAGIPGSLPAACGLGLAQRLASLAPTVATVPVETDGEVVLVLVRAEPTRPAVAGTGADAYGKVPGGSVPAGDPLRSSRPLLGPEQSSPADADARCSGDDDDPWLDAARVVRFPAEEPGAALDALRLAAPTIQVEMRFAEFRSVLIGEEAEWQASRTGAEAGSTLLLVAPVSVPAAKRIGDDSGAALDAAWQAAFAWEDGLWFWQDRAIEPDHPPIDGRVLAHVAAAAAAGAEERPIWQLESAPAPADPPGEAAELAAIGLACHLITHHGGYLAFTYVEDNGLIHEACLAPADDPAGIVAGLLAQPEVVPLLRRDARARLADSRFHDAVRTYAHDLGAEVATRDWLRMPVSVHQRLLAERGLAVAAELPASSDGRTAGGDGDPLAVAPPVHDVPWDAGVVLPGLGAA